MLFDPELKRWQNWMEAWNELVICLQCRGYFKGIECPHCNFRYQATLQKQFANGKEVELPVLTQMGGIDYATHIFLTLMEREWKKNGRKPTLQTFHGHEIPERLLIVILFWNLFETLMDKFFIDGLYHVPENIAKDLLKRYNSIGSRIDQLYKLLFSNSFKDDLYQLNCGHIYEHLRKVQEKRNQFMHGDPHAIDETLITDTVEYLQESQRAWIALYNLRCRRKVN